MALSSFSLMDLSPEQIEVIPKIEKMLALAARAGTPEEAAAAASKAQEFMLAYNLDQARIEANSGDTGKRSDEKLKGGHHEYQRDLWREVAKLNFCIYMSVTEHQNVYGWLALPNNAGFRRIIKKTKKVRTHRLVGRTVNVRAASVQAGYLEEAVERIVKEEVISHNHHPWGEFAMSFRTGMVDNIGERIRQRHQHLIREEALKREEAAAKARAEGRADIVTNMALTIKGFTDAEVEANRDFLDPDRHARRLRQAEESRKWEQQQAERRAAIEKRYAEWAAANPQEAAAEEALRLKRQRQEEQKERARSRRREYYWANHSGYTRSYGSSSKTKGNPLAEKLGYEKGASVSLDLQTSAEKRARITEG